MNTSEPTDPNELLAYIKQRDAERKKRRSRTGSIIIVVATVLGIGWLYFDEQREQEQLHNERVEMFRDALGG